MYSAPMPSPRILTTSAVRAARGTTGGCGEPQDSTNFRPNKALSSMHVRHQFVGSVIYDLPFGRGRQWGSGLALRHRRRPRRLDGGQHRYAEERPAVQPHRPRQPGQHQYHQPARMCWATPALSADERTLDHWFNTDMFEAEREVRVRQRRPQHLVFARSQELGFRCVTSGSGSPRTWGCSSGLKHSISPTRLRSTIPNAEVGNKNFGRITGAGGARNIQFGLKFIF